MKRGFTLIELLVVISIIGTLASVILVSLQSARQKGFQGAGMQFEGHTYQAFGVNATAVYNFDEGSGIAPADISGNNNTLTLFGTPGTDYSWVTDGISKGAISFLGRSGYAMSTDAQNGPRNSSYSITAWIRPTTVTPGGDGMQTIVAFGNGLVGAAAILSLNGNQLNFDTWGIPSLTTTMTSVTVGIWTEVAVSINNTEVKFYKNGKQIETLNLNLAEIPHVNGRPDYLTIGMNNLPFVSGAPVRPFFGAIDSVRIYTQSLQLGDIEKLYAEELPLHRLARE